MLRGAALGASAVVAACASAPTPIAVQEPGIARSAAGLVGAATTLPEAKPFVVQSRPAAAAHIPVGVTPPAREVKALTPAEVEARKAAYEKARATGGR